MVERKKSKPGFFKRLFEDLYEVKIVSKSGQVTILRLKEISRKTNTHIKGRDENGHQIELKTEEPFDYFIKKLY